MLIFNKSGSCDNVIFGDISSAVIPPIWLMCKMEFLILAFLVIHEQCLFFVRPICTSFEIPHLSHNSELIQKLTVQNPLLPVSLDCQILWDEEYIAKPSQFSGLNGWFCCIKHCCLCLNNFKKSETLF
jgi:hypothetical protein